MLSDILQKLEEENFYWNLGFYALILAGSVHFLFIFLFIFLDIPQLVFLNIISVGVYLYCIFGIGLKTLDRKDDSLIGWLVYVELLGHGVIATLYLGLESGFQYYIYSLVLIPFFISTYSLRVRILRVVVVIVVVVLLEIWGHNSTPVITLKHEYLAYLHYMNLILFLLLSAVISYFYTISGNMYRDMLFKKSNSDHLTGLYNRRYVSELFKTGLFRRKDDHNTFALLLIDADHFKSVNDAYGHRGGDEVLVKLAQLLKENVRRSAIVSRWGGEEFLIVLEEIEEKELTEVAERLRSVVENTPMREENELYVTVTLGGAVFLGDEAFEEVFARADKALYQGKQNGRNQVVIA